MRTFTAFLFGLYLGLISVRVPYAQAAFGSGMDKPTLEFSRGGANIVATLIPQGKSTKVEICFGVTDGELKTVSGMDLEDAKPGEINVRDFRSSLFVIDIQGLSPGQETAVSVFSPYFTGSTQYWIFNPIHSPAWTDSAAKNIPRSGRVNELVVRVIDGGSMDSDGLANGAIRLIGGPRDSFWGYALGTLFIRFFGIFLVLTILMLGMLGSSRIFRWIEEFKKRKSPRVESPETERSIVPGPAETFLPIEPVTPEMAAAITLALHFRLRRSKKTFLLPAEATSTDIESSPWALQGREISMNRRLAVFNHVHYSEKESENR